MAQLAGDNATAADEPIDVEHEAAELEAADESPGDKASEGTDTLTEIGAILRSLPKDKRKAAMEKAFPGVASYKALETANPASLDAGLSRLVDLVEG